MVTNCISITGFVHTIYIYKAEIMSVCSLWTLKRLNRLGSKFMCLFKGFQGVSSKEKISRISYPSYIHTYAPKKSNYCGLNPAHEPMNHIDHLMGWNMGSIDLWAQRQLSADGWALTLSYIGLGSEPNWMLTGCPMAPNPKVCVSSTLIAKWRRSYMSSR